MSEAGAAAMPGARCAVHPEVIARSTPCERCGNFACEPCFDDPSSEVCASCRARTGVGKVAWEDRSKRPFDRLTATLSPAWLEPRDTFRKIGHGELGPALTFFLATLAIGYSPLALCLPVLGAVVWVALPDVGGGAPAEIIPILVVSWVLLMPLMLAVTHGLVVLYYLVTFHLAARVLGGEGSVGGSLRGVLYSGAIAPLNILAMTLGFIPLVGPLFNLVLQLGKVVWTGFALAGTAESVHRLDGGRALVAGHVPGVLAVMMFVALFAIGFGLALARID